ncbi:hypothetical protein ACQKWADRAFT_145342 [Trichoderma austrokoningii]
MQLTSVNLPEILLTDKGQLLDLSLKGSMKLQFSDGAKVPETSTDLLKSVAEEHLWIARTGSCHFHIVISIQGERVTAIDHAELTNWIQHCEVWTKAGIRLQARKGGKDEPRGKDEPLGTMSFSIQHPDLSSALVTPKDASTAEFQSVICHVDISPAKLAKPAKPSLKRKRTKAVKDPADALLDGPRLLEDLEPRKLPKNESVKHLQQLLDIALELLVLGLRKQYKGVATKAYTWAECLPQLAPAVFSMQYLKMIHDRALLLPAIATSLARMKNAESPSLRYKTAAFAARVVDNKDDFGDCVVRGIEKSAWDVLLASVKKPVRLR